MTAQILQFRRPPEGFQPTISGGKLWFEASEPPKGRKGISAENRARRAAWWRARDITEFWAALMRLIAAANVAAEQCGLADAARYAEGEEARFTAVVMWRLAIVSQMRTPAPDQAAIRWKKRQLATIKRSRFTNQFLDEAEAVRLIGADIDRHTAHPLKKRKVAAQ